MRWCLIAGLLLLGVSFSRTQSFEECYPDEIEPEQVGGQEGEDVSLDVETVTNYFDICVPIANGNTPTTRSLVRAISEICTEFPIDEGDDCQTKIEMSARYGYNVKTGKCEPFNYTGCGGNENNFGSEQECWWICHDACTLPKDEGMSYSSARDREGQPVRVDCSENAGVYYYYDQTSGQCEAMKYQGCGGNKNKFETMEECGAICFSGNNESRPSTERTTTVQDSSMFNSTEAPMNPNNPGSNLTSVVIVPQKPLQGSRVKRFIEADYDVTLRSEVDVPAPSDKDCDQDDSANNAPEFCLKFREKFPDTARILESVDKTSSEDIDSELVREFESQINTTSSAAGQSRSQKLLFSLFKRPLKHTTVKIFSKEDCKKVELTVRVFCVKGAINAPTDSQKDYLCDLVKKGIKRHWEVNLLNPDNTLNYPVTVNVVESLLLSKKVILQWYNYPPPPLPINPGLVWFPMWLRYRGYVAGSAENERFGAEAAHEFSHDVVTATSGVISALTHEGTSAIFGGILPGPGGSPPLPNNPAPINLVWTYFGGDNTNYYNRLRATQYQVRNLIKYATWRFHIWWCPGSIGAPCFSNKHCKHPGICRWFRCVHCSNDLQCGPDNYCKGIYNPFYINTCTPKKPNGQFCSRDAMCQSGMCDGGLCVECEIDNQCPSDNYCKNNNLPLIENECTPKKENGEFCLQDRVCLSGYCDGGQCVECEEDHHCSTGEWCKYKNIPLVENKCVSLMGFGAWCSNDDQCATGYCDGGRCGDCEQHSHCPSHQYCKWRNTPGVANVCVNKKCSGFCTNDAHCISNNCRPWLLCKHC